MKHTDWQQIEPILASVLELSEQQRSARVEQLCAGNASLRSELQSLLAAHDRAGSFLEVKTQISLDSAETVSLVSKQLGPYRLLEPIGHGGMGTVYRAERADGQFQKQVAVKVVPAAVHSQELLRRSTSEQQILATLEHPNIARLLDAGVSPDGLPYLVMDYVEGVPITDYCRDRRLPLQDRLRLFQTVCSTVHYAHQHLIVHRDIKPANILVTDERIPKLLDFGIAKLLDPWMNPGAGSTQSIFNPMTPDYASPEQARGEALTTATDVYSLGVILYELLANQRPYSVADKSSTEAIRMICELEPEKPSALVRNRMKKDPSAPREPGLSSELDAVVAKAMRKDPQQRYVSAQDLAQDISRYLDGLTVLAHRGSLRYSVTKFIHRHKLAAASVLIMLTLTVAGVSAIIWQAQVAIRERETAKAVNDFLQNDLLAQASARKQAGPGSKPDPDIRVRTALDRAASSIGGKFNKQPLVEASIRQTIGQTYYDLSLYSDAQPQLERALALRRGVLGDQHPDMLPAMHYLACLDIYLAKYADAESLLKRILELRRRNLGEVHPETLASMDDLSVVYLRQGRYAEAEPLSSRALEIQRRTLGEEHPDTLDSESHLGWVYHAQGQLAKAETLLTKVFQSRRRVQGEEHPDTLRAAIALALVYRDQAKYPEADLLLAQTVEIQRRTLGEEHHDTLACMSNLANLYRDEGKLDQAEALLSRVLEAFKRKLGEEHPDTLRTMMNLGVLYRSEGKYDQGAILIRKVLEEQRQTQGNEHADTLWTMYQLARLYVEQGNDEQAEPLLTAFLEIRRHAPSPGQRGVSFLSSYSDTAGVLALVGRIRLRQHGYSQAEAALREGLEGHGKDAPVPWQRYEMQSMLGASLMAQRRFEQAEPLLLSTYQTLTLHRSEIPWDSRSTAEQTRHRIVELYQSWGKPDKAEAWRHEHRSVTLPQRGP